MLQVTSSSKNSTNSTSGKTSSFLRIGGREAVQSPATSRPAVSKRSNWVFSGPPSADCLRVLIDVESGLELGRHLIGDRLARPGHFRLDRGRQRGGLRPDPGAAVLLGRLGGRGLGRNHRRSRRVQDEPGQRRRDRREQGRGQGSGDRITHGVEFRSSRARGPSRPRGVSSVIVVRLATPDKSTGRAGTSETDPLPQAGTAIHLDPPPLLPYDPAPVEDPPLIEASSARGDRCVEPFWLPSSRAWRRWRSG